MKKSGLLLRKWVQMETVILSKPHQFQKDKYDKFSLICGSWSLQKHTKSCHVYIMWKKKWKCLQTPATCCPYPMCPVIVTSVVQYKIICNLSAEEWGSSAQWSESLAKSRHSRFSDRPFLKKKKRWKITEKNMQSKSSRPHVLVHKYAFIIYTYARIHALPTSTYI